jgi:hypothetical protein
MIIHFLLRVYIRKKIVAYQFYFLFFVVLLYQHVLLLNFFFSFAHQALILYSSSTFPQLTADNARFNHVSPSL